ncbi:MAG: response regulator [Acidobacteria bacterium]|nr:response regulator [Acidobacteriota bacterium]
MGKKILLADDSITIQKVIELTFSDEDFEVVTVGNGRLAVEKALEVRPDIVLCDIIMPEKDGYEVCDFIKKQPPLAHVPVLLLTGAFEPFDQERAARVGCDGFLAKPFEPQTLIAKVKDLLSQAASRQVAPPARPLVPPPPAPPPAAPAFAPPPAPAPQSMFEAFEAPADFEPAGSMPAAPPPPPAAPAMASAAPGVEEASFIPDEPYAHEAAPTLADAMEMEETPPAPEPITPLDQELYVADDMDAGPGELMSISPEEPAAAEPADSSSTVTFTPGEPAPWSQPTVEVPLETRAQAGLGSGKVEHEGSAVFEEVFEEEGMPATAHAAASYEPEPLPPPAVVPPPREPVSAAPAPPPPPVLAPEPVASFADVTPPAREAGASAPSSAAEVAVPMDMVQQIAQRVVAQISEKVVREVAWEVIPDLAEALIKKEIERLKAELQQT